MSESQYLFGILAAAAWGVGFGSTATQHLSLRTITFSAFVVMMVGLVGYVLIRFERGEVMGS